MTIAEAFKSKNIPDFHEHNSNDFLFDMETEDLGEEGSVAKYIIKNNKKDKIFKDLKVYFFLYQNNQDFVLFNEETLGDIAYYEGTLNFTHKGEFKYEDTIFNQIKLNKFSKEEIVFTTFAVVDIDAQKVYMSGLSKCL